MQQAVPHSSCFYSEYKLLLFHSALSIPQPTHNALCPNLQSLFKLIVCPFADYGIKYGSNAKSKSRIEEITGMNEKD